MIQAEREIERRVAVPGALRIQKHRPARRDEDVLGADIAVHEADLRFGGALRERLEAGSEIRMRSRGGEEIRLEPDGVKDGVGGELPGDICPMRGGAVDGCEGWPTRAANSGSALPSRKRPARLAPERTP